MPLSPFENDTCHVGVGGLPTPEWGVLSYELILTNDICRDQGHILSYWGQDLNIRILG